ERSAVCSVAAAVLVVIIVAIDDVAEDAESVVETVGARGAGRPTLAVGLILPPRRSGPCFAGIEEVFGVLGFDHDHAADCARAVGVGYRSANDVDLLDEVGDDPEGRAGAMARAAEVLSGNVDN